MIEEKKLFVSAITSGTVLDHILPGKALKIIRILRLLAGDNQITIGLNLKSSSGLKDIIKIENVFLNETQASQIAIFSPNATVNVIQNYDVAKKFKVQMPCEIQKVLACPNPRCITNLEEVPTSFKIEENNEQINLRCKYCEKIFSRDHINERIIS